MNKAELLEALAAQTGQTKGEVCKTLEALLEILGSTLAKGNKLLLVGFGSFETQHRAARSGRNPQTGAPIEIAEATLPKFTPSKALKDRMAKPKKSKESPARKLQGKKLKRPRQNSPFDRCGDWLGN